MNDMWTMSLHSWILFYCRQESKQTSIPLLHNVISGTNNSLKKKINMGKVIEQEG